LPGGKPLPIASSRTPHPIFPRTGSPLCANLEHESGLWTFSANRTPALRASKLSPRPSRFITRTRLFRLSVQGFRTGCSKEFMFQGLPIRKCPHQVRVGLPHLGNHSLAPGLVGSYGPKIPENGLRLKRSFSTTSESRQKRDNLPSDKFQKICTRSLDNYRDFGKKLVTC
jgi:hypothetical protein